MDDCLDVVWRFAIDSGLSTAQATDVCLITLLRLLDRRPPDQPLASGTSEWALRTAVEECGIARRLSTWGRPSLIATGPQGATA